ARSGSAARRQDFHDLRRILDAEARLVAPTDVEGLALSGVWSIAGEDDSSTETAENAPLPTSGKYYQLSHDYLVPSLREWLTRKQKETRRGRAELRLAQRSAAWSARPEKRSLPSLIEWAG